MLSIYLNEIGSKVELFHASRESRERKLLKNLTPCALLLTPNVSRLELDSSNSMNSSNSINRENPMLSALCPMRFSRVRQDSYASCKGVRGKEIDGEIA